MAGASISGKCNRPVRRIFSNPEHLPVLLVATMGKLAEHLQSEQFSRKSRGSPIDHLDVFALGVALGYERLTGKRFTHQGFADGKTDVSLLPWEVAFAGLIIRDLTQAGRTNRSFFECQETAHAHAG